MLEIAQSRYASFRSENGDQLPSIQFDEFNALDPQPNREVWKSIQEKANIVISTLVLEHLSLHTFFSAVSFLLKPYSEASYGRVLMINMHAEMGRSSHAGFMDEIEGKKTKISGESYVYEIEEVVE
ncbi:79fad19b-b2e3-480c-952b-f9187b131d10-CDS [Sclerotinia trifoliorum]|uniref:79fad19b-b2e3-480c-952b-f9187b131d10-CDS n=1 Tax=Sclerotinia trifoliorum TaxID=28548 RepID=A0A8H2VSN0_9HELO|nr:79fad19b-b2e3-480c-952b-f9187b131d10-CDS [Sclerotinia trifoliorum]